MALDFTPLLEDLDVQIAAAEQEAQAAQIRLEDLDVQIAAAEQEAQAAQIRLATLRGERAGVLRVLTIIQNPQPIRTSSEDAQETPPHDPATP
jgi:chromosome segregation ATPase